MSQHADTVRCGFCGQVPEEHGDSDHGPMSVCPPRPAEYVCAHSMVKPDCLGCLHGQIARMGKSLQRHRDALADLLDTVERGDEYMIWARKRAAGQALGLARYDGTMPGRCHCGHLNESCDRPALTDGPEERIAWTQDHNGEWHQAEHSDGAEHAD